MIDQRAAEEFLNTATQAVSEFSFCEIQDRQSQLVGATLGVRPLVAAGLAGWLGSRGSVLVWGGG